MAFNIVILKKKWFFKCLLFIPPWKIPIYFFPVVVKDDLTVFGGYFERIKYIQEKDKIQIGCNFLTIKELQIEEKNHHKGIFNFLVLLCK